jgi:hypothetical protein
VTESTTPRTATLREFAAIREVDVSAVCRWRQQGRLVLADDGETILVDASMAALDATIDPARGRHAESTKRRLGALGGNSADDGPAINYSSEAAREKRARATLAELDLAKQAGNLVPRAEVEQLVGGVAIAAREALLALPGRLAAELYAAGSVSAVEGLLLAELRRVCEQLAADAEAGLQRDQEQAA